MASKRWIFSGVALALLLRTPFVRKRANLLVQANERACILGNARRATWKLYPYYLNSLLVNAMRNLASHR